MPTLWSDFIERFVEVSRMERQMGIATEPQKAFLKGSMKASLKGSMRAFLMGLSMASWRATWMENLMAS